ncbi:MAG: hypothetical protein ACR2HJ_12785 [Fimbriimonadales bacterium]
MKARVSLVLLALVGALTANGQAPKDAIEMVGAAQRQAVVEKKNVFVVFDASW